MVTEFKDIKACVFDAYGTLFDVHSAVGRHRDRLGDTASGVSITWRDKQLQYTWLRALMGRHVDFWRVTGDALDYALETHDVDDSALRDDLMQAYLTLEAYPEVPAVLKALHDAGIKTAVLSNGSPQMLTAAVESAGIEEYLDDLLSVEDVGVYKPDPRVYQLAVDRMGAPRESISFQSSNSWDAAGAAVFGFRVVWINRFGQRRERLDRQPDIEDVTLDNLPRIVGASPMT